MIGATAEWCTCRMFALRGRCQNRPAIPPRIVLRAISRSGVETVPTGAVVVHEIDFWGSPIRAVRDFWLHNGP